MLLISELIKELQEVLEEHGDVDIRVMNEDGEAQMIEDIAYYEDSNSVNQEKYLYLST